jgi:hypothetical protein
MTSRPFQRRGTRTLKRSSGHNEPLARQPGIGSGGGCSGGGVGRRSDRRRRTEEALHAERQRARRRVRRRRERTQIDNVVDNEPAFHLPNVRAAVDAVPEGDSSGEERTPL